MGASMMLRDASISDRYMSGHCYIPSLALQYICVIYINIYICYFMK